jgi:hypothetical protein
MTTTVNDLVLGVRRRTSDWGAALMTLTTQMSDTTTTMAVGTSRSNVVTEGRYVECDLEEMLIDSIGQDLTVVRAQKGTVAAIHEAGTMVLLIPRFSNLLILDALNRAVQVLAGYLPLRTVTTTIAITSGVEEYAMPSGAEQVELVEMESSTSDIYRPFAFYTILDQYDPPRIRIPLGSAMSGRSLRVTTMGQYADLQWGGTNVVDIAPKYLKFLIEYACGTLIEEELGRISGETEQAAGVAPRGTNMIYQQQLARNLMGSAFAHLDAVRPMTRVIHRSDKRVVRA